MGLLVVSDLQKCRSPPTIRWSMVVLLLFLQFPIQIKVGTLSDPTKILQEMGRHQATHLVWGFPTWESPVVTMAFNTIRHGHPWRLDDWGYHHWFAKLRLNRYIDTLREVHFEWTLIFQALSGRVSVTGGYIHSMWVAGTSPSQPIFFSIISQRKTPPFLVFHCHLWLPEGTWNLHTYVYYA